MKRAIVLVSGGLDSTTTIAIAKKDGYIITALSFHYGQKHNFEIVQLLEAEVLTKAPATFKHFYKQRNRWYKGSLINVYKYRKLVFNKNYGDFGVIQIPMILISASISVVLFAIYLIWTILKPLFEKLYDLSYINFDFGPILSEGVKNYTFLNLNLVPMFYGFTILIFPIFLIMRKEKLSDLKNIGEASAKLLNSIEVFTKKDIEELGPVTIYFILKDHGYDVSMNMVYALQGAIMNRHWNDLPKDVKAELIEQIETSKF